MIAIIFLEIFLAQDRSPEPASAVFTFLQPLNWSRPAQCNQPILPRDLNRTNPRCVTKQRQRGVEPCAIFAPGDPVNFVNLFRLDMANLNSYAVASNRAGT